MVRGTRTLLVPGSIVDNELVLHREEDLGGLGYSFIVGPTLGDLDTIVDNELVIHREEDLGGLGYSSIVGPTLGDLGFIGSF